MTFWQIRRITLPWDKVHNQQFFYLEDGAIPLRLEDTGDKEYPVTLIYMIPEKS